MKKESNKIWLRGLTALTLALSVFFTSAAVTLAGQSALTGEIIVTGISENSDQPFVLLNGEPALNGRTFIANGSIATTENTNATVKLGKLGFVTLTPNSKLNINFADNKVSGTLTSGQINVSVVEGTEVNIQTPDSVITNKADENNDFMVDVNTGTTQANVKKGSIVLNNGKKSVSMKGQDDDDDDTPWLPIIIFAGVVGGVTALVLSRRGDDEVVSPIR